MVLSQKPVCPWYYPIPCLVSRPRVASLGIRDRPNGGIARKNYVPALFRRPDPLFYSRIFARAKRKERKKERRRKRSFFRRQFSNPRESKVSRSSERKFLETKTREKDVSVRRKIIFFDRIRNKNTYARLSMPLKTALPLVAVYVALYFVYEDSATSL